MRQRTMLALAAIMVTVAAPFVLISPAEAAAATGINASIPILTNVQVGQTNLASSLRLRNNNDASNAVQSNFINLVVVTPSCGGPVFAANPPCLTPDPGVFALSPTGLGAPGTQCAGVTFNITPVGDAAGSFTFARADAVQIILAPPSDPVNSTCTINFTANVIKAPNIDATGAPGLQTFVNGFVDFVARGGGVADTPANSTGSQIDTISRADVVLTTQASTNSTTVSPGTVVSDAATVNGAPGSPVPTGTVTYTLTGPNPNPTCTSPIVGTSGPFPIGTPSGTFTVTTPGVYNFLASYSGDANYSPINNVGCNAAAERFTVVQLPITLSTQASTNSGALAPGTSVTDQATLTPPPAGPPPTGTVTYTLVGPGPNAGCTAPIVGSSTQPVGAPSAPFIVTAPGTYNFVATYSGDVTYAPITTPAGCNDPLERFTVARTPIQLTTQASTNSTTVPPGTVVSDQGTLTPPAGGPAPTGTVTYTLTGPNPDVNCAAPVVGTATVAVGLPSGNFTVNAPGIYNFLATYSGDPFYAPITTPVGCNVPAERFTVALRPIGLSTLASTTASNVAPGTVVTDTAVFTPPAGGPTPTGTVTYSLFGPNVNPGCTAPAFGVSSTAPVGSPSAGYTVTAPGTYNFLATYSGDANYAAITTPAGCGDPNERFAVALQPLTLATQASTNATTVTPGTAVTDIATLTGPQGAPAPTGTVTYVLVGPNPDVNCIGPVVGSSTVAVGATSASFTVNTPGAYNFVATYSGDAFYAPITTPVGCGVAAERFTVVTRPVTLTTAASTTSATVAPGTAVTDLASITVPAGGAPATGTVTYTLTGPNPNVSCTLPVVGTSTMPVGLASAPFTVSAPGTYNFVATYSGDINYSPITAPVGCGVPAESFAVALQPITLTTAASTTSATVAPGTAVTDIGNFTRPAGSPAPTGTVTYTLVGPNPNGTCTAPLFGPTSTVPVGAPSAAFSPTTPGIYNFVAIYSGDAFYAPITTPVGCGDPTERFTVALQTAGLATTASTNATNVLPGSTVTDLATLTPIPGGPVPTGNVTYTLVGPNPDAACAGPAVGSPSVAAVGQPSGPYTVTSPGAYNFLATYSGDAFYAPITTPVGCNVAVERFSVIPAPSGLVTRASPPVPVGGQISDTATLSGGVAPTGTITFTLFGPNNTTCAGAPVFTSSVAVNHGNGDYPSGLYTITAAGSYRWIAVYSGDANNAPAGPTACADPLEVTAGNPVTPALVTVASAGVVGGSVFDTATLSNGYNPTGTITFRLYANDTCTGTPLFTSIKPVTGNGQVVSDTFILPAPGTYHFVATYSGDGNNNPVGPTACLDPDETIGVGRLATSVVTRASGTVTVGGQISDSATLSGGLNPTGTITFTLFGPNNTTCSGAPIFTSPVPVNGNGTYPSALFTTTQAGLYRWIATYSGDVNNAQAVTACADPLEQVTVLPLPTIRVDKTAIPASLPQPGGNFVFHIVVTNTSGVALTIRTLPDSIYGDVTALTASTCRNAIGTVLAPSPGPGNTYTCDFVGPFFGLAGAQQTDVVTVTAIDDMGNIVTDNDDATVTITPVPPSIVTTKAAAPSSLQEPGGTFTFTYSVTNTGPAQVTVTSIVDNIYGDLNGRGTCAIGAVLAANGGSYSCSFTGNFFGDAGAAQTDEITTVAVDQRGVSVTSRARATVTITDLPPSIRIVKSADPLSRPAPGGTFRFTVVVTNTSFEPITTTSLVDDIYGDINGRGSCAIGVVLAANGGAYSCAFDGNFTGKAGDSQTDTVTVIAVDNDGTRVTASAKATVTLTPVGTPPVVPPVVPPTISPTPQILVRTGSDLGGPARLAGILLLVGMMLVAATRWFGDGPGLAFGPAGPGPGGPGGGSWFGDGNWFGGARLHPPRGPFGGAGRGAGLLDPPAPEAWAEPAWDTCVGTRAPARSVAPPAPTMTQWAASPAERVAPPAAIAPPPPVVTLAAILTPESVVAEVLVPTVVVVRRAGALDNAALDAAEALAATSPMSGRGGNRKPGRF